MSITWGWSPSPPSQGLMCQMLDLVSLDVACKMHNIVVETVCDLNYSKIIFVVLVLVV